jgi:hypothetical protein
MWGIGYIKRKLQERRAKYEAQTPEEKAAWRTANATVAIAIFTVVLAFVGVFTLHEVIEGGNDTHALAVAAGEQAQAAATQARINQMQLEINQRPWIAVKSVTALLFKWQPYMGSLAFNVEPKITYTNLGTFPAAGIRVTQQLFFANQYRSDFLVNVKQRQRQLCEGASQSSKAENRDFVQTLYPGRDGIYSVGLGLNPPTKEEVRERDKIITPVLVGCIFYQYLSSPTVHYTGFIFLVERGPKPEEGSGQTSYSLTFGEDVPIEKVVFAEAYNGNASYN